MQIRGILHLQKQVTLGFALLLLFFAYPAFPVAYRFCINHKDSMSHHLKASGKWQ